jgi:hypothetical protein
MDERNPYAAPGAKVTDPAPRPGSPYKAVGLGLLADLGGTTLYSIALVFLYSIALASQGLSQEEIEQALRDVPPDSLFFWIGALGGMGFSVLGGYVCARVALQSEYTLGAILAVASVVLGTLLLGGTGSLDLGLAIVLHAGSVAAVIAGAHIGKKQNRAARRPAHPGE